MNEINPIPPSIPPQVQSFGPRPLGEEDSDRVPIPHAIAAIDAILRHPRRIMFQLRQPGAGRLIFSMLSASVICCLIYGVVAGTFTGGSQLWVAPVKIV